jgi:hypothetical protein
VIEGLFLKLAGVLALTISQLGPATLRLFNALADFRDVRFEERCERPPKLRSNKQQHEGDVGGDQR